MHSVRTIGPWLLVLLIALLFTLTVTKPIVLTASDLGRHLTNGRLFLESGTIATTNLYSYTEPDFPFLNHHWGSGVLFEVARRIGGFSAVSLFGAFIVFCTALLYLRIAWKQGHFWMAITAAFIALPVLSGRAEIRPELFSYLLSAIFLWILLNVRSKQWALAPLLALPVLMLLWVNLHIYFFLGIGWIGAFLVEALIRAWLDPTDRSDRLRFAIFLAIALLLSCGAVMLNPNGWRGAIYPLLIFQNYAYAVAENRGALSTLANRTYPPANYYIVALVILWLSWAARLWRQWRARELPDITLLILSVFASIIAWGAIRNFTVFAYVALVSIAYAWNDIDLPTVWNERKKMITAFLIPAVTAVCLVLYQPSYWPAVVRTVGIGTMPNTMASIDFFKENKLKGPIFNNYDIGGFLTYGLYPEERVFVDNRPEAYPGTFFTDVLLPMQELDRMWNEQDATYHFNVIFFYRHDATQRGQGFLLRRINDPEWAPVFVDDFTLVFLRRTPENQAVIAQYEIPKSRFSVQPRS